MSDQDYRNPLITSGGTVILALLSLLFSGKLSIESIAWVTAVLIGLTLVNGVLIGIGLGLRFCTTMNVDVDKAFCWLLLLPTLQLVLVAAFLLLPLLFSKPDKVFGTDWLMVVALVLLLCPLVVGLTSGED